jgi:hypothetical protein
MTSPKRFLVAALTGVLLGFCLPATPAFADVSTPTSGTLTWAGPAHR